MVVLDSSAILAFLWNEPGEDAVRDSLEAGEAACVVVNWSEVAAKVLARCGDWAAAEAALTGYGLTVIGVEPEDAVRAARRWLDHPSLSLGDRLCLAVAERREATVLTTDRAWAVAGASVRLVRPLA